MDINTYQQLAVRTINKDLSSQELYENMLMGLMGEAGEIIDILKKIGYHGHSLSSHRDDIEKEAGDLLWYLASLATLKNISLKAPDISDPRKDLDCFLLSTDLFTALYPLISEGLHGEKPLGDLLKKITGIITSSGLTLEGVLEKNIAKLRARYPEGFTTRDSLCRED